MPVRIDIPQATLDNLSSRLEHARWPDAYALDGGEDGARLDRIKALLERWRGGYDWRDDEARLNEYEQEMVNGLHVLKAGRGPRLVLMNGWPSTSAEFLPALTTRIEFRQVTLKQPGTGRAILEQNNPELAIAAYSATVDGAVGQKRDAAAAPGIAVGAGGATAYNTV